MNGAWNLAILTPEGIVRRMFDTEPGEITVQVDVPMNVLAPMRVTHKGVVIIPSTNRIVVGSAEPTLDGLRRSAAAAARAIQSLPETPVTGAGLNVRYRFDSIPEEFLRALESGLDDQLSEQGHQITSKTVRRAIAWHGGSLNLEIAEQKDSSASVLFNFDRRARQGSELIQWLGRVDEMSSCANELMRSMLGTTNFVTVEEARNG